MDNWGIYFLQRLQLFFSKTDYCDLTLQFEGNVQLKVHRLVMNACTEYFTFLEQTCSALDDSTIIMPSDLQADVIVPIVNFMYTGMLEYHPSIFTKLYKAAEVMNIAVLTKLLDEINYKNNPVPKGKKSVMSSWQNKNIHKPASPVAGDLPSPLPARKLPVWKRKQSASTVHPTSTTFNNSKWIEGPIERDPLLVLDNAPKPTRFEWPDDDLKHITPLDSSAFDSSDVSLTSKPLWTKEDDQKAGIVEQEAARSGLMGDLREYEEEDGPPVKEQPAVLQSEVSSSSRGGGEETSLKRKSETKLVSSPKRVKITELDDETVICIKTSNPSELDHTKVVSEILKKFPGLVKKKKNIKLKIITAKGASAPAVKEKPKVQAPVQLEKVEKIERSYRNESKPVVVEAQPVRDSKALKENKKPQKKSKSYKTADFRCFGDDGPWACMECLGDGDPPEFVLYYLFRKHMTDVHAVEFEDSLCKYCGKKCVTDVLMAFHLYTKHGLIPNSNMRFPKCSKCPLIAVTAEKIQLHSTIHGEDEVQCQNCKLGFFTKKDLHAHVQISGHCQSRKAILDCAYCTKKLQSSVGLFNHVRTQHFKEAIRDGITSLDEKMDFEDMEQELSQPAQEPVKEPEAVAVQVADIPIKKEEKSIVPQPKERVKILSNVKVSKPEETHIADTETIDNAAVTQADQIAVTTATTALSNIGGSLATNLGLVDIVVLDDNQPYILQQPQGQPGNEFILPELGANDGILQAAAAGSDINSTDELVMVLTDHDYQDEQNNGQGDNSNIVVLYSHPVEGQQGQFITSQGNLLVNSQGMLEIRNGAAITTTAGQLLVNTTDNTITTQASPSPIESIELIRKEIESGDGTGNGDNSAENTHVEEGQEHEVVQPEPESVEHSEEAEREEESTTQAETNGVNSSLDTTDSLQEEPMEVEEIGPPQIQTNAPEEIPEINQKEEVLKEEKRYPSSFEGEHAPERNLADILDIPPLEATDDEGHDIPPVQAQNNTVELNEATDLNDSGDGLILNDTSSYEAMEVDGITTNIEAEPIQQNSQVVEITKDEVYTQSCSETDNSASLEQHSSEEYASLDQASLEHHASSEQLSLENHASLEQVSIEQPHASLEQHQSEEHPSLEGLSIESQPDKSLEESNVQTDSFISQEENQNASNELLSNVEHQFASEICSEIQETKENENCQMENENNENVEAEQFQENATLEQIQHNAASEQIHENVDLEQIHENVDLEQIHENADPEQVHENIDTEQIHENIDTEQTNESLDTEQIHENLESEQIQQNMEQEHIQQNDNSIQSHFEDFTDESQQSSSQKVLRNLNKEILDDWDDTDSQQSQRSRECVLQDEQTSIDQDSNHVVNEAVENVNKLMDDWDEEDEEQSKD